MKKLGLETLKVAQELATNFGDAREALSNIGYDYSNGCECLELYAKTSFNESPWVRILFKDKIMIETHLSPAYDENGNYTDDYNYFSYFRNNRFTEKEFIEAVEEFKIKNKIEDLIIGDE